MGYSPNDPRRTAASPSGVYAAPTNTPYKAPPAPAPRGWDQPDFGNPDAGGATAAGGANSDAFAINYWREYNAANNPSTPTGTPWPTSGSGSYGGGGYGGPANYTSGQTGAMADALGNWRPDAYSYNQFNPDPYQQAEMSPRNTAIFDMMRGEIGKRKKRALGGVDKSTQYMLQQLAAMKNPYQGIRTTTPQMAQYGGNLMNGQSAQRMNQEVVDPLNQQSQTFDDGLRSVIAGLGGAFDQSQQSRRRETDLNDYYYRNQAESDAGNMMFGTDMADAQDAAAYQRYADEWGRDEGRFAYGQEYGTDQLNWQGQNSVDQANVAGTNDARTAALQQLLSLLGSTADGDLSAYEGILQ